jgi:ferredoxin
LSCQDPLCINYEKNELPKFKSFSIENDNRVCPTNSITWHADDSNPTINNDICIKCGLCVKRCPIGAIYMDEKEGVIVNEFIETSKNKDIINQNKELDFTKHIDYLKRINHSGVLFKETDKIMDEIYQKINYLKSEIDFENILTRNLLIETNINCSITRQGDVNTRMDGLFNLNKYTSGVLEIEFGPDILDTPRNILDNIAVLSSRYEIKYENIIPLIINLSLPNERSEYWQVIADIAKVLNIKINSLTIGALMIINWNLKEITSKINNFYIDSNTMSIKEKIENIIDRKVNLKQDNYSVLSPKK